YRSGEETNLRRNHAANQGADPGRRRVQLHRDGTVDDPIAGGHRQFRACRAVAKRSSTLPRSAASKRPDGSTSSPASPPTRNPTANTSSSSKKTFAQSNSLPVETAIDRSGESTSKRTPNSRHL